MPPKLVSLMVAVCWIGGVNGGGLGGDGDAAGADGGGVGIANGGCKLSRPGEASHGVAAGASDHEAGLTLLQHSNMWR